jgi:hypothetical protein
VTHRDELKTLVVIGTSRGKPADRQWRCFVDEAFASLPGMSVEDVALGQVIVATNQQPLRLRANQQVPEQSN